MTLPLDLKGKKGLVVGIANEQSIAYGCARVFRTLGAELAITYFNERARPHVVPLAEGLNAAIILPCDVQNGEQVEEVFKAITEQWGKLDFLLHSVAFAPKADLQGRVVDSSLSGFLTAMDISCHSFMRLCRYAEPLMKEGGSLMTVSYMGSHEVVSHYNIMGPVKAALESATRYMAAELGRKHIRVNALSPGAITTRASSGICEFDAILSESLQKSPIHRLIDLDDVGYMAAFLAGDAAKNITGGIHVIDAGYDMMA